MTRKFVALCLLILIPVTLNCMAASDITSAWGLAMSSGGFNKKWVFGFALSAAVVCAPFTPIGSLACSAAAAG